MAKLTFLLSPFRKKKLLKTFQFFYGLGYVSYRIYNIKLYHFFTVEISGIGYRYSSCNCLSCKHLIFTETDIAIAK